MTTNAELEELLAKATPGPWRVRPPSFVAILGMKRHVHADGSHIDFESMLARVEQNPNREANADLIALAPTLAAEVVRLRGALIGVVKVADRKTVEFDAARQALAAP